MRAAAVLAAQVVAVRERVAREERCRRARFGTGREHRRIDLERSVVTVDILRGQLIEGRALSARRADRPRDGARRYHERAAPRLFVGGEWLEPDRGERLPRPTAAIE